MKYSEIKQFTKSGSYTANVPWKFLTKSAFLAESPKLIIDPDYQRGHVWTDDKRIKYIEFILQGGKSSRILYCNCPGWMHSFKGPFELVDGKQRLTSVLKFLNNEIKIFGGYYKDDFEDKLPLSADFIFNVNDLKTRKEVLQWYIELNSGGVVHTDEEIEKVKALLKAEE